MPLMSAFSFVQHLPIDLLRLCLQYLPLTDVAIFDHAILSHKYRPTFLAAIEGLELFDINFYLTSDLIQWLMTRGVLIKSIPLSSSDANLLELINYSHSSLKSIDLSHSRLSDDLISAFLSMCPNLVSINFHCSHLTDYGLRSLLEVKRNLQHLNLSGCTKITSDSLQILAQYGSALRNLNLSSLRWMTDAELLIILDGCPQIQDINVSSTYITIDSIVAIIQRYPMLNSLIFSGCARVTRDATKLLLRSVYSRQIMSKDPSIQLQGVLQLNNAFSSDPRLISEMISLDLLPRLVSLLNSSPSSEIQIEICDIFSSFPSLSSTLCFPSGSELLVSCGAISALLNLLQSRNAEVIQHICWVGTQWAVWTRAPRSLSLISPALHILQNHPHRPDLYLTLIINIFRSKNKISLDDLFAILQTLCAILHSSSTSNYVTACRILRCLPGDPHLSEKIIELKLIPRIVSFLKVQRPDEHLVREVFEVLEKMMDSGKLELTPELSNDIFSINLSLLDIKDTTTYSSICSKCLMNLLQRYPSITFNQIISKGFISRLLAHIDRDTVLLVINICKQGSVHEKNQLVDAGILKYLIMAASRLPDEEAVIDILNAILIVMSTVPIPATALPAASVHKLQQYLTSRTKDCIIREMLERILSEIHPPCFRPIDCLQPVSLY